jgi:hypothetical protein
MLPLATPPIALPLASNGHETHRFVPTTVIQSYPNPLTTTYLCTVRPTLMSRQQPVTCYLLFCLLNSSCLLNAVICLMIIWNQRLVKGTVHSNAPPFVNRLSNQSIINMQAFAELTISFTVIAALIIYFLFNVCLSRWIVTHTYTAYL